MFFSGLGVRVFWNCLFSLHTVEPMHNSKRMPLLVRTHIFLHKGTPHQGLSASESSMPVYFGSADHIADLLPISVRSHVLFGFRFLRSSDSAETESMPASLGQRDDERSGKAVVFSLSEVYGTWGQWWQR